MDSPAPDHPTPCPEPVAWMGFRSAFGKDRVRFYACEKHVEGLTDPRAVNRSVWTKAPAGLDTE